MDTARNFHEIEYERFVAIQKISIQRLNDLTSLPTAI